MKKFNKFEKIGVITLIAYGLSNSVMGYIYYNVKPFNTVWMVVPLIATVVIMAILTYLEQNESR